MIGLGAGRHRYSEHKNWGAWTRCNQRKKRDYLRITHLKFEFVILVNFTRASPVSGFSPFSSWLCAILVTQIFTKADITIWWNYLNAQEYKWSGWHCCCILCWNGKRKGSRRHKDIPCVMKIPEKPWYFSSLCLGVGPAGEELERPS